MLQPYVIKYMTARQKFLSDPTSTQGVLDCMSRDDRDWFEANPGRCMMSIHKPFTISKALGAQWAEAMQRAIADVAPADAELAKAMGDVLGEMARGMSNV